jgi:hypothetical protein
MIDKTHLQTLGYRIKTRELFNGSTDYVHQEVNRTYLVNFDNGKVHIVFPTNDKRETITFDDPKEFENWHEDHEEE